MYEYGLINKLAAFHGSSHPVYMTSTDLVHC